MDARPAMRSARAMTYVALLRAVNLGGASTLPMADLRALCEALGFTSVRTYIASGNVVFDSGSDEATVKRALEGALAGYAGKPIGVVVRTGAQIDQVAAANPFPDAAPDRTVAIFLDAPPPPDFQSGVTGQADEAIAPGLREIYVHYPSGQGRSKLRIPAARAGTARNLNTIARLAAMSEGGS
jgi:uncharacterized protein (DUF1697 family)